METVESLLRDPEVRSSIKRIVEYEEKWEEELKTNPIWSILDVPVEWHVVRKLIYAGVVKKIAKKDYRLVDRSSIKQVISELEVLEKMEVKGAKEAVPEIPSNMFDTVVGYDDVKQVFLMSLKAEKPTHILLCGPPSSCKTVMLLEIARLKDAFYLLGGSTTKVGLIDQLFNLQPRYVLLDEADKMGKEDYTALLSLMETGIVKEVKHDKTREMMLNARVYAACNVERSLPPELLSRFHFKLHFKPYAKEEFVEVSRRVLMRREGLDEELATYIAEGVAKMSRDVRDCVGIARMSRTKEDVDFLIKLKRKYLT